jgi:hypothetical protein
MRSFVLGIFCTKFTQLLQAAKRSAHAKKNRKISRYIFFIKTIPVLGIICKFVKKS